MDEQDSKVAYGELNIECAYYRGDVLNGVPVTMEMHLISICYNYDHRAIDPATPPGQELALNLPA